MASQSKVDRLLNTWLQEGQTAHQQGDLNKAEECYLKILKVLPEQQDVRIFLGLVYLAHSNSVKSIAEFKNVLKLSPDNPVAHCHLGSSYMQTGNTVEAIKHYQKAIDLKPDYADACYNLGVVYQNSGEIDMAIQSYEKEISIRPDTPLSLNNLGLMYTEKGRLNDARACFEKAVNREPGNLNLLLNLAQCLYKLKETGRTVDIYEKITGQKPELTEPLNHLGACYSRLGRHEDAMNCFQSVLNKDPDHYEAQFNLANTLQEQNQIDEALLLYKKIRDLKPTPLYYTNYYQALMKCGQYEEAKALILEGSERFPEAIELQIASHLTLPRIYKDENQIKETRGHFSAGLTSLRDLYERGHLSDSSLLEIFDQRNNFLLSYQGEDDKKLLSDYGELHSLLVDNLEPHRSRKREFRNYNHKRIRVAYISPNFKNHTVSKIMSGFVKYADRTKFEVYTYYIGPEIEDFTRWFQKDSEHFYHLNMVIDDIENRIVNDEIDILFLADIGMAPIMSALAARRLAPVQCTTWNHPVTSGYPNIDYFISSELMEPKNSSGLYSEKLVMLKGIGIPFKLFPPCTSDRTREDFGLPENRIVYISSQSLFKYLPQFDEIYSKVLKEVPDSILVLIEEKHASMTTIFSERLKAAFKKAGVDFETRCKILPRLNHDDFQKIHSLSDVYLDSIPWSSGSSILEVWCTTPIPAVTIPGRFMRERHMYSMLKVMDLDDCIAQTNADYIDIAVKLGKDRDLNKQVRRKIEENRSRLYENKEIVVQLEEFYSNVL